MTKDTFSEIIGLGRTQGVFTAGDASRLGIHSQKLTRLVAQGVLERVSRGQYRLVGQPVTEHHGLVMAAKAIPEGVVSLLSALSFHGIGSQLPSRVWLTVPGGARAPRLAVPPLQVVRATGDSFSEGIELHQIEGVPVRIYSVAKTIADLFKHRNKVGIDVAIEALREAWRDRRFEMPDLERAMSACRVTAVIRPYLEAIVA